MDKRVGIDFVETLVPEHLLGEEFLAHGVEDIDIAVKTPETALTEVGSGVALHCCLYPEILVKLLEIESVGETPHRHLGLIIYEPVVGSDAITYLSAVRYERSHRVGGHGRHTVAYHIEAHHLGLLILARTGRARKNHHADYTRKSTHRP